MTAPVTPETARFLLAELDRLTREEQAKLAACDGGDPPLATEPRASLYAMHRLLGMLDYAAGAAWPRPRGGAFG